MYKQTYKDKRYNAQQQTIEQSYSHLLADKAPLLSDGQILIHKNSDSDSQRLGSHISGHIKYE